MRSLIPWLVILFISGSALAQELSSQVLDAANKNTDLPTLPSSLLTDAKKSDRVLLYSVYDELQRSIKLLKKSDRHDDATKLKPLINEVRRAMNDAEFSHPFAAELVTGTGFLDASSSASGVFAASDENEPAKQALIRFESKHFRTTDSVELVVGGSFGIRPALTGLEPEPSGDSSTKDSHGESIAKYEDALAWDFGMSAAFDFANRSELFVGGSFGQTRLFNSESIVDVDGEKRIYFPLGNDSSRFADVWKVGVEFRFYEHELTRTHEEKKSLQPLFEFSTHYVWDKRFQQEGVLEFADKSDEFLKARFMIYGLSMIDRRPDTEEGRTFTVSLGVEVEKGTGGGSFVDGTRIFVQGDADLMKILTGGGE